MLIFVLLSAFVFSLSNCDHNHEFQGFEYLNTSVNPCDNFYEYACGNFKNVNPRPEKYPLWDNFVILQQELHQILNVILGARNRDGDPESIQKSRAAYAACVNTKYADELPYPEVGVLKNEGPWPLIAQTGAKANFSWSQMGDLVANYGVQYYMRADILENPFDVSQYLILLGRDTVLNPSIIDQYEDNSVDFLNYVKKTKEEHPFEIFLLTVANILRDATGSDKNKGKIQAEVAQIFDFMKLVQQGGTNTGGNDNVAGFYTIETLQEWVDESFPKSKIDFSEYLNRVFSKSGVKLNANTYVLVSSMSWFYGILDLMVNTSDDMLRNFVFARLFTYTAPDSNNEIRDAYNHFRVNMNDMVYTRREYCTRYVLGYPNAIALSMAATYEYQRYHFNTAKMQNVSQMINDLQTAFLNILDKSDWLDEPSRQKAKEKASKMITLLGYPNFVEDGVEVDKYYSNVRICAWDHFGNAQRLRAFSSALNLALLDKPRDREKWNHSPLVVNAFYNSQNNRIILPVSILNPIFYNGRYSEMDYARIGAIIGHEITHGFDNQGSQYDGDGNLSGWWSAETKTEFKKREQCFRDQYGGYFVEETGKYIDPDATMRENLADNGGLREAFQAFKRLQSNRTVKGYTSEQLFFISYGTMWCAQETPQQLEKVSQRGYSPARFRVIGSISNNVEFAKAFNCPVGSNMNPADKCILW
ncbi:hypothetical protein RN001_010889 [Aquatica leii]|uniref:Uncharacterized protein n=1 Tax=Aquatica leii TaxID=1421715 RepID=A0AAN7SNG9_9COLE|nr:hypothetical protein RN001_010889 [Aquatica leii]